MSIIYGQPITFGGGKKAEGEISITANGTYDVTKYASANVNVQSEPVLLWTNASPTSNFGAQTVNVASGYSAFLIELRYATWDATTSITYLTVGGGLQAASANRPDAGVYTGRKVTTTNATLVFKRGGWPENDDTSAIPTRIWGVKFTL